MRIPVELTACAVVADRSTGRDRLSSAMSSHLVLDSMSGHRQPARVKGGHFLRLFIH